MMIVGVNEQCFNTPPAAKGNIDTNSSIVICTGREVESLIQVER